MTTQQERIFNNFAFLVEKGIPKGKSAQGLWTSPHIRKRNLNSELCPSKALSVKESSSVPQHLRRASWGSRRVYTCPWEGHRQTDTQPGAPSQLATTPSGQARFLAFQEATGAQKPHSGRLVHRKRAGNKESRGRCSLLN